MNMAKTTKKTKPDPAAIMRAALEAIVIKGGVQGTIAKDALMAVDGK